MRTLLNQWENAVVWGCFFATTIYGHIALKLAAGDSVRFEYANAIRALATFWGWSAMLAWTISGVLWGVVLTKNSLFTANSVSSLRYLFICLAGGVFLRESILPHHGFGILLVTAGVWICTH